MQRIFCVKYSMDSKYVLSGSDDGSIRLWKAKASEKLGPVMKYYIKIIKIKLSIKFFYSYL